MNHEAKDFKFRIKDLSEDEARNVATFTGFASVYSVIDLVGDVVEPGAFSRTLDHNNNKTVLLYQHNPSEPLGMAFYKDSEYGLEITGELNLDVARARETYSLMKQGAIKGISIGYSVVKHAWDGTIRRLQELKLHESSTVTFPANEYAVVTSVKAQQFSEYVSSLEHDLLTVKSVSGWNERQALARVMDYCSDDDNNIIWEQYAKCFLWTGSINGKKASRGLIADVLNNELVAVSEALTAHVAKGIHLDGSLSDVERKFIESRIDAYFEAMGKTSPIADSDDFVDWAYKGIGIIESKYGRVLSNRNRTLVEEVVTRLSALLTDSSPSQDAAKDDPDEEEEPESVESANDSKKTTKSYEESVSNNLTSIAKKAGELSSLTKKRA